MTTPLPGWYQDPDQPTLQKWWDGREWSTYTMPLAAAESPDTDSSASGDQTSVRSGNFTPSAPSSPSSPGESASGAAYPGAAYPGAAYPGTGYPGAAYPGTAYPGHQGYPAYPNFPGYPQPFRTNPLALTGFILGLAGFFVFFIPIFGTAVCLAAVVFSAVGLFRQAGRAPRYKVFGIIGLVLGAVFMLMSLLIMMLIFSGPLYY